MKLFGFQSVAAFEIQDFAEFLEPLKNGGKCGTRSKAEGRGRTDAYQGRQRGCALSAPSWYCSENLNVREWSRAMELRMKGHFISRADVFRRGDFADFESGFLKEISAYMNQYAEESDGRFADPETFDFLEALFPRTDLDSEERAEIFALENGEAASEECAEHIDAFN